MSAVDDFDIKLWLLETHISEPGLKKLALNAVDDLESLQLMSLENISSMRLAAADSAKFFQCVATVGSSTCFCT
jgi:hypothetical protein